MPAMLRTDIKPRRSASFPWYSKQLVKILGGKKKCAGQINAIHSRLEKPHNLTISKVSTCFLLLFPSISYWPEYWGQNDQAKATRIFRKVLLPSSRTLF